MNDIINAFNSLLKKINNDIPSGIYPDNEDLEGLNENEKYFFHFCDFGIIDKVKKLHKKNINVDIRFPKGYFKDSTPLMWSSSKGHYEVTKYLIDNGADINALHKVEKKTVLTMAIENCNSELAKYLLHKGADIKKPNKIKSSGLIYARKYELNDIVDLLKAKGAK